MVIVWLMVVFRPTPLKNDGLWVRQLGMIGMIIPNWMEK